MLHQNCVCKQFLVTIKLCAEDKLSKNIIVRLHFGTVALIHMSSEYTFVCVTHSKWDLDLESVYYMAGNVGCSQEQCKNMANKLQKRKHRRVFVWMESFHFNTRKVNKTKESRNLYEFNTVALCIFSRSQVSSHDIYEDCKWWAVFLWL